MSIDSGTLLRSLGSGVLPKAVDSAQAAPATSGPGFDQVLQQAQVGTVSSGIPVTVSSQAGLSLSSSQLARLADAADRAQSAGASRALVVMDGMVLTMDVGQRTVTGKADLSSTRVLNGVDAVVTVAPDGGAAPTTVSAPGATTNASLLKILAAQKSLAPVFPDECCKEAAVVKGTEAQFN